VEPYAIYGHFYDATQSRRDGSQYLHLLRRHHPQARTLLEIACGTAAHLAPLANHYEVTGLDISATMLLYARRKLPTVQFHCQNMAGFKLDSSFDVVICPYDSINHLLRFEDWVGTFKAAKRHLNPKGTFIFDINTQYRLRKLASAPPWTHRFGANYVIMQLSTAANGITDWDIRVFEHVEAEMYRLHREVIKERSFAHKQVKEALQACFDNVRAYDLEGWSRPKATSGRLFYVCA
jgi:SAM-dependent methyltransferase